MLNTISLDEQIATEPETILDDEQKNDYTAFDRLISKMKLTAVEYETLSILTLFRTKDQKISILRKSKLLDFPTMPTTAESLPLLISFCIH